MVVRITTLCSVLCQYNGPGDQVFLSAGAAAYSYYSYMRKNGRASRGLFFLIGLRQTNVVHVDPR